MEQGVVRIFKDDRFGEIRIVGTPEDPYFCLADLCKSLEITHIADVKRRLKQDGVGSTEVIDSLGRKQVATFVNEQNLYKLIMRSDKPQAEEFQDWVCGEVIPSIRKHGAYMTEATIESVMNNPDNWIQLLTTLKKEREQRRIAEAESERLALENEHQAGVIEEQRPKAVFADAVIGSKSSCLIGELAKIITQNGYKIGQNKLFEWLRANHYLGSHGEYYNIPYQKYIELGYFELKKSTHSENGVMCTTVTPKVKGKGQVYFVNKFLDMLHK